MAVDKPGARELAADVGHQLHVSKRAMLTGFYECDLAVQVGRPNNKAEILSMIRRYDRVKAVGIGHRCALQAGMSTPSGRAATTVHLQVPAANALSI